MFQPEHIVETPGAQEAAGKFNPGEVIIEHVANSSLDHPLIHLPKIAGIDFSVTKHVLMVWIVSAIVFVVVTLAVRRYLRQDRHIPSGFMNGLEFIVLYVRDNIAEPNVGKKWVNTYTPLLLTLFVFIFAANLIGIIPIFDVLSLINHTVLHAPEDSFFAKVLARRRHRDRQLQRDRGPGHGDVSHHHRRRVPGARLRAALEEPRAARRTAGAVSAADPARDYRHACPAVRVDDATCGQHDGRPHRDSRDPVVRVHLLRAVRPERRRWAWVSCCRCLSAWACRDSS